MTAAKVLTPITDRNGKRTSVWRNVFSMSTKRELPLASANAVPVSRVPIEDALLMPRNPYVRVVPMEDGSKTLYIEARSAEGAIAHDANNDMSYRLPVSALMDIHGIEGEERDAYDRWVHVGDLPEANFALMESMGDLTMEEFIAPLMEDDIARAEMRRRFFDPRSLGEKTVLNPDGSIAGYLYPFRDATDMTLEEIRPDLVVDYPSADIEAHKDFMETEKHLADHQAFEDGVDAGIRDDYFDDVVEHIRLYGHPKAGVTRLTFFTEDSVIKFPLNAAGMIANANENRQANHKDNAVEEFEGVPVAENELRYTATGMPYLVMERVDTNVSPDESALPKWAEKIDGWQVGINSKGEYVAFDL